MRRFVPAALVGIAVASFGSSFAVRDAQAEESSPHAVPLAVLAFDTPDADEQSEAFTGALRSHVRAANGFYLVETTPSLSSLTAAMGCSEKPDPACEKKIADHLKVDHFVWGTVKKAGAGFVQTETHLFSRKQAGMAPVTDKFSDNLKDQNDDALRKIAGRVLEKLDEGLVGRVHVRVLDDENHAALGAGTITIGGGPKQIPIKNGAADLVLAPGSHRISVSAGGHPPQQRTVIAVAGKSTEATISFAQAAAPSGPTWFTTKRSIGLVAVGAGVAAGIASVVFASQYFDIQREQDARNDKVANGADVCSQAGGTTPDATAAQDACQFYKDNDGKAKFDSAAAVVAGGLAAVGIGVGAYLIATGGNTDRRVGGVRLLPYGGPQGAGVSLGGAF